MLTKRTAILLAVRFFHAHLFARYYRGLFVFAIVTAVFMAVHLLLVDVAMIAPLVCVWFEWRENRQADAAAGRAGRTLARWAIYTLLGGILVGGLLLAGRWWVHDRAISRRCRSCR